MPIRAIIAQFGGARLWMRSSLGSGSCWGSGRAMPATVIAEQIGWSGSMTVLKDRVRPLFTSPAPASRPEYQPGELAQCDLWFPPVDIPLGFEQAGPPPVLVMVSGYSRMIPSRQSPDLPAGRWALVRDNESGVGQWRAGRPQLTESMNAFRGTLGSKGHPVSSGRSGGQGPRDHYVGRRLEIVADLEQVVITLQGDETLPSSEEIA